MFTDETATLSPEEDVKLKKKGNMATKTQNAPSTTLSAESPPVVEAMAQTVAKEAAVKYSVSPGFYAMLKNLNLSVAVSSYQSGKFYLVGRNPKGGLMVDERLFQQAMGICVDNKSIILGTLFQIQRLM